MLADAFGTVIDLEKQKNLPLFVGSRRTSDDVWLTAYKLSYFRIIEELAYVAAKAL